MHICEIQHGAKSVEHNLSILFFGEQLNHNHFSREIAALLSSRNIVLSISQEDLCPLIFRLISIKGSLCPSLSDHLLAARKYCADGRNIMPGLHKKPLIALLEEMCVYFDQEDKVNVKKVNFSWIFQMNNLSGMPCCMQLIEKTMIKCH